MKRIRESIAAAMGVHPDELGCFTLTDHSGQKATLIIHGEKHQGVWLEWHDGTFKGPFGHVEKMSEQ